MIRKILSVIAGYLIFAVTSVLLFKLAAQDPHQPASGQFMMITLAWGIFFSVIAGMIVQLVSGSRTLFLNYILASMMFAFAAISMILSKGSHWTQLFAMLVFAPVSIVGGILMLRRKKKIIF